MAALSIINDTIVLPITTIEIFDSKQFMYDSSFYKLNF